MSYQSVKRVLGETSLERKCRFLFGACLLVLITSSFWWYGRQTEKLVYDQNRSKGRLLVAQAMYGVHWKKLETETEYRREGISYMAWEFSKEKYTWRPILPEQPESSDHLKPENMPHDEFEVEALRKFSKPPTEEVVTSDQGEEFLERTSPDGKEYRYYLPIRAKASCIISCHAATSVVDALGNHIERPGPPLGKSWARKDGDLLAVIEIAIPNGPTQRAQDRHRAMLWTMAIVTVFLAMVAAYVIVRYVIVKPLKHLRDVSDAISHGNITLRAEIHTGDEFEALAVAFNRMLRSLVNVQDELRQVNTNLDGKVDELAQANMQLYEMNRLKSDFMATMSHELRTPLNSILGFSEVLESIDTLDEKQKRYVQNIQKSGRMLLEMINNILDLAKIENGKMDIRLVDFHIERVIAAQCDMARPLTEKKNIDLDTEIEPGLPTTCQDQSRVQQILNNLLSNAIKFTPEGGRITVSARKGKSDQLLLEVADTGVGIAQEEQQAIFEKFRQSHAALSNNDAITREFSGTGLGLSIVKELCKLLGGEVTVESELGKGSRFTVSLPQTLEVQPRLDYPFMVESFDQFSKPKHLPAPNPDKMPASSSTSPTTE